jgi:hypothetical protein
VKTHTLRGQVTEGTIKRLIIDDGRLTHAMRITKFVVSGDPSSSANDVYAVLGLQGTFPRIWDWSDNNQIAWASSLVSQTSGVLDPFTLVDQDHLIIRDLYITGTVGTGGGTDVINYYIEMEAVDISHDESILQLIKERSQGELRA